jgi:hypothetical protein
MDTNVVSFYYEKLIFTYEDVQVGYVDVKENLYGDGKKRIRLVVQVLLGLSIKKRISERNDGEVYFRKFCGLMNELQLPIIINSETVFQIRQKGEKLQFQINKDILDMLVDVIKHPLTWVTMYSTLAIPGDSTPNSLKWIDADEILDLLRSLG